MAGHEVEALTGRAMATFVDVWTADDAFAKFPGCIRIGFQEAANIVAVGPVPFLPFILSEAAYLV